MLKMGFVDDVELILGIIISTFFLVRVALSSDLSRLLVCLLSTLYKYCTTFDNLSTDFAGKVDDVSKVQTLLFSATLPSWVKQV